ncbi:MAG TPA: hypothetical protein PLM09_07705 [Casimicrobiaceae bacterium]|nr:hypothetical protein [Casimicrobiaceae bacterium]
MGQPAAWINDHTLRFSRERGPPDCSFRRPFRQGERAGGSRGSPESSPRPPRRQRRDHRRADQHDVPAHVDPQHEERQHRERAVDLPVGRHVHHVPGESGLRGLDARGGEHAADERVMPAHMAVGHDPVGERERHHADRAGQPRARRSGDRLVDRHHVERLRDEPGRGGHGQAGGDRPERHAQHDRRDAARERPAAPDAEDRVEFPLDRRDEQRRGHRDESDRERLQPGRLLGEPDDRVADHALRSARRERGQDPSFEGGERVAEHRELRDDGERHRRHRDDREQRHEREARCRGGNVDTLQARDDAAEEADQGADRDVDGAEFALSPAGIGPARCPPPDAAESPPGEAAVPEA